MASSMNQAKHGHMTLIAPRFAPPLDAGFRPAVLANHAYTEQAKQSGQSVPLILSLERAGGAVSRFETVAYPEDHSGAAESLAYCERLVKFLLWQRGSWQITVGGPEYLGRAIRQIY